MIFYYDTRRNVRSIYTNFEQDPIISFIFMEKLVILNLIHLNSRPCKKILIPQYIFTTGLEMFLRYLSTWKISQT